MNLFPNEINPLCINYASFTARRKMRRIFAIDRNYFPLIKEKYPSIAPLAE